MSRLLFLLGVVLISTNSRAQVSGKVFGMTKEGKEIIAGAYVHWLGTDTGTTTNENGVFKLGASTGNSQMLVVSSTGYKTDTVDAHGKAYLSVNLQPDQTALQAVTVSDSRMAYISSLSAGKTEVITQRELTKAACCDLAGCFGTQGSVQPQTTNVVTNAQELRILGLSGVYNQVLVDGLPMIQGASYTYGISTYPGTVVENIYVSKGTTSVLQGFESISGQINMETRQPNKTEPLLANAYINSFGEKHFNVNLAGPVGKGKKWHSLLALHSVQPSERIDNNGDGFMDLPLLTRYMAFNKWKYGQERQQGLSLQIGLRAVKEKRVGGQYAYAKEHEGGREIYGQVVDYTQAEGYIKSVYRLDDQHALVLNLSAQQHQQESWFGPTRYEARQEQAAATLQHEWQWSTKHNLKWGLSYRHQDLKETIWFKTNTYGKDYAGDFRTQLRVPGLFAENSFHWANDNVLLITGARLDRHQDYGYYFTPRGMLKWSINSDHTFRASAGTGWRQVNLFSEQVNILVSSKRLAMQQSLKPESAANWGLNHTYRFTKGAVVGTLSADYYHTFFYNQFYVDYDLYPGWITLRNLEGNSSSNSLQLDATFVFFKRLEARVAYNYLDVYRKENGLKELLPFNPRNRAMGALSYQPVSKRWQADANVHWFDPMRLPNTRSNPDIYRRPLYSSAYASLNVQGTFRWKAMELYAGCENVFGYVQTDPIIGAAEPFGPYFDISSVWGPTRGRELYAGIRWSLKKQ